MLTARWNEVAGLIIMSYLSGSISLGYRVGFLKGHDLLKKGSGSAGKTNVLRILGPFWSNVSFLVDISKATAPVVLVLAWFHNPSLAVLMGAVAIFGHCKSIFIPGYGGGKGVASMLGVALGIHPLIAAICYIIWDLVKRLSRYVSVASMLAAVCFAAIVSFTHDPILVKVCFGLVALFVIFKHRENIKRLRAHEENKVEPKKEKEEIEPGTAHSAFAFHPVTPADFYQTQLTSWLADLYYWSIMPLWFLRALILLFPVMKVSQIAGIEYPEEYAGAGRVELLAVAMLPNQIKSKWLKWLLKIRLQQAAVISCKLGADVLTLGALLSSESPGGGQGLQNWCDAHGLKIIILDENEVTKAIALAEGEDADAAKTDTLTIDNGAGMTEAATLEALDIVIAKEYDGRTLEDLPDIKIGIIGANGLIGYGVSKILEARLGADRIISVARHREKADDPNSKKILDLSPIYEADVVIFTTSSALPIVDKHNAYLFQSGKKRVWVDVAVPPDLADIILTLINNLTMLRSGLMQFPGKPKIDIDFHFGKDDNGVYLAPACCIQGQILAKTKQFQHASRGARIRPASVEFYLKWYKLLGYRIQVSILSEPSIYGDLVA